MRLSPVATVGILLGLALIPPGCGEQSAPAADGGTATSPRVEVGVSTTSRACRAQLYGLVGSMDDLRGQLAVGMSYGAYLQAVKAAQAAYSGVKADRLELACLVRAGTPAERALNLYIAAANTWGGCIASASCNSETVEPKLQRKWKLASTRLSAAQAGLRARGRD
jgi:hypothetical protein